jgi:hypothetical protein
MRTLTLLAFLFAFTASAATWTEWTMVVTNGTTTNDAYSIGATVRRGATNRTATTFTTNASPRWATTNILSQFGGWRVTGVLITNTGPTNIVFSGFGLIMTASNFCTLSSNGISSGTNTWSIDAPVEMFPTSLRTSNGNQIVYYMTNASAVLPTNAAPLSQFATRSNTWMVGAHLSNSVAQGLQLTNASGKFTNSVAVEWAMTNTTLVNATGSIHKPILYSGGSGEEVIITNTSGNSSSLYLDQSNDEAGAGIGVRFGGDLYWGFSFDTNEFALYSASGNLITLSAGHVYLGDAAFPITAQGVLQPLAITNGIYRGTNVWNGDVSYPSHSYSSMGNTPGINRLIPTGTNVIVELSGATTISHIGSFENTRVGKMFRVIVSGQVTNVILNQDLGEATAALRITTGTGGNVTQTNNPAWFDLLKRSGDYLLLERSN